MVATKEIRAAVHSKRRFFYPMPEKEVKLKIIFSSETSPRDRSGVGKKNQDLALRMTPDTACILSLSLSREARSNQREMAHITH